MVDDNLTKIGLHIDDLNKLRILESDIQSDTNELKEECGEFNSKVSEFQRIVQSLLEMVDTVAKEVEREKMKAIGARNLLKSVAKQRESEQQQLQALIAEKRMESEKLRIQLESLQKQESEQTEFVEQFLLQE